MKAVAWQVRMHVGDATRTLGSVVASSHAHAKREALRRWPFAPAGSLSCINTSTGHATKPRGFAQPAVLERAVRAAHAPPAQAKRASAHAARRAWYAQLTPSQRRWHDLKRRRELGRKRNTPAA